MSDVERNMLSVKLYMKAGCHLCEEADSELSRLRARYAHTLERVDINSDDALIERYGERIPVLVVGEREYAAPLSHDIIEHALASAPTPGCVQRLNLRGPSTRGR